MGLCFPSPGWNELVFLDDILSMNKIAIFY